jgi:hypothetical protein
MPVQLRGNDHIEELRAAMNMDALRHDMRAIVNAIREGRSEQDIGDDELRSAFERASPDIERDFGVDIWDAMVLLAADSTDDFSSESQIQHSREWEALHSALSAVLSHFGKEDPYGNGDYWIVENDYGHPSHMVCVSQLAFITPELVSAVQQALKVAPHWVVLLQVDEEVNGGRAHSTGLTVRLDGVERHSGA